MKRDRTFGGQRDMWSILGHVVMGGPLHDNKRGPSMRLEVSKPQTRSSRKPEGTIVNNKTDGRRMRTAIRAGGSKDAVSMTVEQGGKPITSERLRLWPSAAKGSGGRCIA